MQTNAAIHQTWSQCATTCIAALCVVLSIAMVGASTSTDRIATHRLSLLNPDVAGADERSPHRYTDLVLPFESTIDLAGTHEHVERAVFTIHGTLRNAGDYHNWMRRAARDAGAGRETALITPQFLIESDLNGMANRASGDALLFWTNGGWKRGDRSLSTRGNRRPSRLSSYAALERLIHHVHRACPNLREMVLVGHSAGGQFINRFAAGNRMHDALARRGVTLTYVICNPSSYLYFCAARKVQDDPPSFAEPSADDDQFACARYNRYRYGTERLTPYLATLGVDALARQYASRSVVYLMGAEDNDPEAAYLDRNCAAMLQGAHRLERGQTYHAYLAYKFGDTVHDCHQLVVVPGVGHSAPRMFLSPQGRRVIFNAPQRQRANN